eukprot:CAMPEP_0117757796 /NCGR_PEP_ID=MMETSP0947-20121206/14959_1 /TAXON_ID=44440 /ORGANISM="Chattonella subsalsa, Strain CCMP2191" /LENGTH=341 /DNA_ID=CAMNT_0005577787 /DNA_START=180 /DNA_END=1205 /DNA_ORIENTATION=+
MANTYEFRRSSLVLSSVYPQKICLKQKWQLPAFSFQAKLYQSRKPCHEKQQRLFSKDSRWDDGDFSDNNIALLVSYDGTDFEGFTEPGTKRSVEKWLRTCLEKIHSHEAISLRAASRTDKGVHARGQVVCYKPLAVPFHGDFQRLTYALNRMLPDEIRVTAATRSPFPDFHPTFDAIKKRYIYQIDINRVQDPMRRLYSWHCPPNHDGSNLLNLTKMKEAAKCLVGKRDFQLFRSAFRGNERGRELTQNTICDISRFDVNAENHNRNLIVCIEGDRFLYKMVRNMVGMMVQIGKEQITVTDLKEVLNEKIPPVWPASQQRLCAPAHGLFLDQVMYKNVVFE